MPIQQDLHIKHKKHRNVLYSLVILLAIIHIVSFSLISAQVSKLSVKLDKGIAEAEENSQTFTENLMSTYDALYQADFKRIHSSLEEQQEEFAQEISLLKSPDLTGVANQARDGSGTIRAGTSTGSFFFLTDDGYLVTNYHVIESSPEVVIAITNDGTIVTAELISFDTIRDLALLKIPGDYEAMPLASSNEVEVGESVLAVGNPLGLSFTVTEGIVSAVDREGPNGLKEYVQTDVSLNPGNSGGPLVNRKGEVIGINNFKIGGAESLGFALEADTVRKFFEDSLAQLQTSNEA